MTSRVDASLPRDNRAPTPAFTEPPPYATVASVQRRRLAPVRTASGRSIDRTPSLTRDPAATYYDVNASQPRTDVMTASDSDVTLDAWMGREGSMRSSGGSRDKRTRLFGSGSDANSSATPAQKSSMRQSSSASLKKNVRFADKNETLDISRDDDVASLATLNDDLDDVMASSMTSAPYVLDDESMSCGGDTFV